MEAILILIFIALIVAGIVVYVRGRERERVAPGAPAPLSAGSAAGPVTGTDVRGLKPGDVVNHEGRDYIVEGTVRYEQGGYRWEEHRLVDAGDTIWLSVEDDEGLELVLWQRLKGVVLEPGAGSLDYDGVSYELDERGKANFTSEGATGMAPGGRVEYADYEAGDRRLAFERGEGDESWEISVGQTIDEGLLDVYPSRGTA